MSVGLRGHTAAAPTWERHNLAGCPTYRGFRYVGSKKPWVSIEIKKRSSLPCRGPYQLPLVG
jgi:hypothetical protein